MKATGKTLKQLLIGLGITVPAFLVAAAPEAPAIVSQQTTDQSCPLPPSLAPLEEGGDVNLFVTCGGFFD